MAAFDRKDKSRYETFSRRAMLLGGGMTAVFGVLAGRLYQLQILQGDRYMTQAEDNRVNQRLVAPLRGRIFDRFGVPLAANRQNYRLLIVPEQAPAGVAAVLDAIGKIIPLGEAQKSRVLKQASINKKFVPLTVTENLSWEEFARLNLDLPYLAGVQLEVGETRDYPFADETAHVLGYVAAVSPEDKTEDDPLLDLPSFRIGKRGIEKTFDKKIRGRGGQSRIEVNAYGRVIRELGRDPGQPGEEVYLTLDREIQHFVHERLAGESAACTVMDCTNGDVLALASTPGYDPNSFNVGISATEWKALTENDHKPLINKALSGLYPPGSTFKAAVALAAVEDNVVSPDFAVVCTGKTSIGSHDFHCWKKGGHGRMNLHNGIKQSCDVYFYEVARRLGVDRIEAAAKKLGMGEPTGIEIPGERAGLVPSRAWRQATFGAPWQQGETLILGIGQGYVLTTPIQLCMLAARVASGKKVSPRIVHSVGLERSQSAQAEPLDFSERTLTLVRAGLNAVTNEGGGTAYAYRIAEAGMEMAGKSGTAQVRRISAQERLTGVRRNEDLPWELRDHALFIAYAPVHAPRYACAAVIEHGMAGSRVAGAICRDVLLFTQKRDTANRPPAYPVTAASAGAASGAAP